MVRATIMSKRDGKRPSTTGSLRRANQPLPRTKPVANTTTSPPSHKELEVILMRQLADCLAMPIFIVNVQGTLLFYNEPAERLLGLRFEETGELSTAQWSKGFVPTDNRGRALAPEKLPLVIALRERRPAHADFHI